MAILVLPTYYILWNFFFGFSSSDNAEKTDFNEE